MSFIVWILVLILYVTYLLSYREDFVNNNILLVYYLGMIGYLGFESYESYKSDEKTNQIIGQQFPTIKFYFLKIYITKIIVTTVNFIIFVFPFLFVSFNIINRDQVLENTFLLTTIAYYFILFGKLIPKYVDITNIEKKIQDKIIR